MTMSTMGNFPRAAKIARGRDEKAGDYLVMIAQTLSASPDKAFKFTVARWALHKLDAAFLSEQW
jgi:hypothetical protein